MLALDSLKRDVDWSFGGGTAMRLFHDHRESKDVDIFVTDPYVISALSPRLNGTTERLTGDYSEMSNYLKLRFLEGEVDFIIAPKLVDDVPFVERVVRGRSVKVESSLEIVAKKCFYRSDDFTARDIFDLAVLIHDEPQAVERHRGILLAKRSNLERRLGMMRLPNGADAAAARTRRERARTRAGGHRRDRRPPRLCPGEVIGDRYRPALSGATAPRLADRCKRLRCLAASRRRHRDHRWRRCHGWAILVTVFHISFGNRWRRGTWDAAFRADRKASPRDQWTALERTKPISQADRLTETLSREIERRRARSRTYAGGAF